MKIVAIYTLLSLVGLSLQVPTESSLEKRYDGWCNTVTSVASSGGFRVDEYPAWKSGGKTKVQTCILKEGAEGKAVEAMQYSLAICHGGDIKWDGIFGPKTKAAVKKAQKEVKVDVDGVWGPETGKAMHWSVSRREGGKVVELRCKSPSF